MLKRIVRKPLFLILVVMGSALGLVSLLAMVALKPINKNTGFNRKLISGKLYQIAIADKPKDVLDFAGNTSQSIFFKTIDPSKLYITDINLLNGKYISLAVPNNKAITSRFNCIVDSPDVYICAGNLPGIVKKQLGGPLTYFKFPESVYSRAVLISSNSFAFRIFDHLDQVFAKGNLLEKKLIKEKNISQKIGDAGISTDGQILYDKKTSLLSYVFYYKNEIIVLDTALNLIRKIKTIDINTVAPVKSEVSQGDNMMTSLTPKRLVNAYAATSDGLLFNYSRIKADNESSETFRQNSIIDVYDVKTGLFKTSFYVPIYKNELLKRFIVANNQVVGIYRNFIVSYQLPAL